ncbi:MAG: sigma-54-dependent transcriptional regulator, partial [Planctomycetota bacterium]
VLVDILAELGHETSCTSTAAETIAAASGGSFDLVLLDLRFPDCADLSTLSEVRRQAPSTDVIMITAETDDLGVVTEATSLGAFDYVPKPIRDDDIRIRVARVGQLRSLSRAHDRAVSQLARGFEIHDIVGNSPAIRAVIKQARDMAAYEFPVLITGETGTGKELVARALHYGGPRRDRPFVSINCAALASGLTESELFGHERGAFTGASQNRRGAFEEAEDGTLFLDEIGDMSPQAQASLLHVLESGEFRSVGGKVKKTAARVILASNQNLEVQIEENKFRKDLYYRINRLRIKTPPLRRRTEDIPVLASHLLRVIDAKIGKGVARVADDALAALRNYAWPGNVRELKNEIERAYLHCEGSELRIMDFSPEIIVSLETAEGEPTVGPELIDEVHRLTEALRASGGNLTRAGEMLGVHRNTIRRWMKKYALYEAQTPNG